MEGKAYRSCLGVMGYAYEYCSMCGEPLKDHPSVEYTESDTLVKRKKAMSDLKNPTIYAKCDPIELRPRGVWIITFSDGDIWLKVTGPEMGVGDVVEAVRVQYPGTKFKVGQIDEGTFRLLKPYIPKEEVIYRADSRYVTSEGLVSM